MADEPGAKSFDEPRGASNSGPAGRDHGSIESELIGARQRMQSLLAVSPAIIYTTQASGDGYRCTFVSENLRSIMGYSPEEMTTDPKNRGIFHRCFGSAGSSSAPGFAEWRPARRARIGSKGEPGASGFGHRRCGRAPARDDSEHGALSQFCSVRFCQHVGCWHDRIWLEERRAKEAWLASLTAAVVRLATSCGQTWPSIARPC